MGKVHKIGEEYYVEFEARGLKYQQKAGPDEQAAWKLLAEIEGKIKNGEMGIMVRDVDVDIFWRDFINDAKSQHTMKTVQRFLLTIEHFDAFCKTDFSEVKKLSQLTPKVFERYRAYLIKISSEKYLKVKPRAINLTLMLLRGIFDYAIKLGYLNDNPVLHIRMLVPVAAHAPRCWDEKKFNDFVQRHGAVLADKSGQDLENFLRQGLDDREFEDHVSLPILRNSFARYVLRRGMAFVKLYKFLGYDDIVKTVRYIGFWGTGGLT